MKTSATWMALASVLLAGPAVAQDPPVRDRAVTAERATSSVVSSAAARRLIGAAAVRTLVETPPLIVRRAATQPKQLLRWDLAANAARPLYRTKQDTVQDLAVAPDERYVAVIETKDGVVDDEGQYSTPPVNQLVVLDGKGRAVLVIKEDVRRFRFSPDGKQIAFVTGRYYEGGVGFQPDAAWIVNLADPRQPRVRVPDVEDPFDLDWLDSGGDRLLYVRALAGETAGRFDRPDRVVRFSTRDKTTAAADDPGAFHFSPDGRFYLAPGADQAEAGTCAKPRISDCTQVIDRAARRPVAVTTTGRVLGWAYGRGAMLLSEQKAQGERIRTRVLDVASRREVEKFEGAVNLRPKVWEWHTSRQSLVVKAQRAPSPPPRDDPNEIFTVRHLPTTSLLKAITRPTASRPPPAAARLYQTRMTAEPHVDRPGHDYRSVWLDNPLPSICEAMCLKDRRCKAYTYVKPGVQGAKARCYLKNRLPTARRNACCVSGARQE